MIVKSFEVAQKDECGSIYSIHPPRGGYEPPLRFVARLELELSPRELEALRALLDGDGLDPPDAPALPTGIIEGVLEDPPGRR